VNSLVSSSCNRQNYLDFNRSVRLTIQIYSHKRNPSSFSNSIFPDFITGKLNNSYFRGKNTKLYYYPSLKGSQDSYKLQGGVHLTSNELNNLESFFDKVEFDNILKDAKLFAIEWVTLNSNLDFITYNLALFTIGIDGILQFGFKSVPISQYFYSNHEKSMVVLVLISLVLCCYFFLAILIDLGEI
jgi:hypothetical protein